MVNGYVAGANRWLQRQQGHRPGVQERGLPARTTAKGLGKITALDLWYGVYLANLLASSGVFVKEIVDATPPSPTDPGIPDPNDLPLKVADLGAAQKVAILEGLGRDPERPFGSNATAVGGDKTTTKRGMLLGNPHFPWRGRYHFTQQHLTIPGKYDVAGASLIGSPVGQHRLEQARRVEPHRLHGLPLHALRVPPGRSHDRTSPSPARSRWTTGRSRSRCARPTAARHRRRGPVAHRRGLRRRDRGHADALDAGQRVGDQGRQRRAPAHHRHLPRHGQGQERP